ncbi:MAG: DUF3429 domain-containing protein [Pseudomonadota bacterium]
MSVENPKERRERLEMTALGLAGLIPFAASAFVVWIPATLLAPFTSAAPVFALAYAAVIAAYLTGAGAGAILAQPSGPRRWFAPGQILLLIVFFAALPDGVLYDLAHSIRFPIVIAAFLAILAMDLGSAREQRFPPWYGKLRIALTAGVVASLAAVLAHPSVWGAR